MVGSVRDSLTISQTFFFLKHGLNKVNLFRPILKAAELLSFAFAIVIIISHLDALEEGVKCNNAGAYIGSHNLIKNLI